MSIEAQVREFIVSNFAVDEADALFADDASLLDTRIIDSTGVLELILFLEEQYGLHVPAEDVVPAHFDSVAGLAAYIRSRLADAEPEGDSRRMAVEG